MFRLFFTSFFILFSFLTFSQQLVLDGCYYEKNLFVLNPSLGNENFCVKEVYVNNVKTNDEVNSNAFEIDLSHYKFNIGDSLKIILVHSNGCTPKIANPDAINPHNLFKFISAKVDRKGVLVWKIDGDPGEDPFGIEQFRWNKWVNVDEVQSTDTVETGLYNYKIKPNSGNNLFRIYQTDGSGNTVYSKDVRYRSMTKEVFLTSPRVTDVLSFSDETMYEIFDDKGNFILDGTGTQVDVKELTKGKYWVNYDNKTEQFTKK